MTDEAALGAAIGAAWHAGRAAWPEVELARERFAELAGPLGAEALARHPADVFLAIACRDGAPEAIAAFEHELLGAAVGPIRSIDDNRGFVDEACQRLRASLLVGDGDRPRIADYAGRGPLRAWVGVSAVRTALMLRRSQQRAREVPIGTDDWSDALATLSTGNPELDLLKRQYATAFSEALRHAVAGLPPRLRAALRMSFVDGLSIDEIGAVYAVHRATAARWIQRACDGVLEHTRDELARQLALTATELDRVAALVQSQLDVSLSQLLPANLDR
ncbi:MAG: sigma factor-like helix-turn-helix DNA-binding protein [Kofleriaceae bacterium]